MQALHLKKKNNIVHLCYVISFFFIFIQSSDARNSYDIKWFKLGLMFLIFGSCAYIFKEYAFNNKFEIKISKIRVTQMIIWAILCLSFVPACSSKQLDSGIISRYVIMYVLYFLVLTIGNIDIKDVCVAAFICNVYICYRCTFELGLTYSYYQGTTINPNQFGMTMLGGVVGTFYLMIFFKNKISRIILLIFEIIFLAFIVFSSSRTNMLAVILGVMIFLPYYLHKCKNIYLLRNNSLKISSFLLINGAFLACVIAVIIYRESIVNFFFNKWGNGGHSLLSSREDIWLDVLKNMKIFSGAKIQVNTNGEFLNWINEYGFITFAAFFLNISYLYFMAVNNYNTCSSFDNIFYIIVITVYLFIALFENIFTLFGKPINIIFLMTLGYILKNREKNFSLNHWNNII